MSTLGTILQFWRTLQECCYDLSINRCAGEEGEGEIVYYIAGMRHCSVCCVTHPQHRKHISRYIHSSLISMKPPSSYFSLLHL